MRDCSAKPVVLLVASGVQLARSVLHSRIFAPAYVAERCLGDPIARDPVVIDWRHCPDLRFLDQIVLSPDGEWAARWGSSSNILVILESGTGRLLGSFPLKRLMSICFSADGRSIFGVSFPDATGGEGSSLHPTVAEWRRNVDGSWERRPRSEPGFALGPTPKGAISARANNGGWDFRSV